MPPRTNSATPGPTTRLRSRQSTPQPPAPPSAAKARPTLLPAASVGSSSGYGAPGKPLIRTQIATTSTTLSSVLENADDQTGSASPTLRRDPSRPRTTTRSTPAPAAFGAEEMPPPPPPASRAPSRRATTTQPTAPAPAPIDAAEMARNGTFVEPGAPYVERPRQPSPRFEPGNVAIAANTLPRFVPAFARGFFEQLSQVVTFLGPIALAVGATGFLLGMLWLFIQMFFSAAAWAPLGERFTNDVYNWLGTHPYSLPPSQLERAWIEFRLNYSFRDAMNSQDFQKTQLEFMLTHAVKSHEKRIVALEETGKLHEESISALEELIPSLMAVRKIDGQWEIPEAFWPALEQKLSTDFAPLWDAFLRANEKVLNGAVSESTNRRVQELTRDGHVISGKMFTEAVAKNYEWLDTHFKDEMRKVEHEIHNDIRRIASQTTTDIIASTHTIFTTKELELLAKANQVRASYEALRQHNFFATGLGARIDADMTSPTFGKGNWLHRTLFYDPHPPIAALQRWEEATDCWCAAPSTEMGKAQITVLMNHVIFPERLVIEHIPASGTLNISTAPRNLEVWAERLPGATSTTEQIQASVYEWSGVSEHCEGPPPSKEHICIGRGKYEIHSEKVVQSFAMMVDTASLGLAARRVTVRVTGNWGGRATCLYRLRMTGARVDTGPPA
ncbi:hypothetical protein LTR56_009417 [Elasticomyces elasticus]|nr:hypothetical protein LTR56_009417 [Elasticomyces elasticus]KAK3645851.1 hypothetical protein LTR22_014517 [Elasticomyces elasticus]KAK4931062.1 hypothetical protein LTR49_002477 [Elasticomyces elasticus]KAK5765529.1 hypothetical protein LTS12_004280 [Elasticomyces elasticus]